MSVLVANLNSLAIRFDNGGFIGRLSIDSFLMSEQENTAWEDLHVAAICFDAILVDAALNAAIIVDEHALAVWFLGSLGPFTQYLPLT